jgi:hypothetical protein
MAVPSLVAAKELERVARLAYINQAFRVALVDAPGSDFEADDSIDSVLANEVEDGRGGYQRQQVGFVTADLGLYDDGKTQLARKAATFVHNGNPAETIRFSHVCLINPAETGLVSVTKLAARATLSDAQSAIFYFDFTLYGVFVAE